MQAPPARLATHGRARIAGPFSEPAVPATILRLALPSPLRRLFDYAVPADLQHIAWQPGMRLQVPFGRREIIGILVEVSQHSEVPADKLKPALALLDAQSPLPPALFKLCLWTAQYYQHSLGDTLSWALPVLLRQGEPAEARQERFWQIAAGAQLDDPRLARAPRQREALQTLAQHPHGVPHRLLSQLQLNKDSLDLLLEKALVTCEARRHPLPARHLNWLAQPELPLNPEQQSAVSAIQSAGGHFNAFLLAGVPGSGKTEVYLQLIHQTLAAGKQALVLIPEINLGPQTLARFEQRFNARIALLHSNVNDRERLDAWLAARDGEADIIIGTQLVAKGHNFPVLTLVGVIDADLGLQGSDLRAAERTFQLMRQVAGRAGRGAKAGVALLQTFQPEHAVIRAILGGDEEGFWRAEAAERRAAGMPPYGRMAGIILSSPDLQVVFDFGAELARRDGPLRRIGAQVWGPAPAPIARVRGRHRVRLLVKADKAAPLQAALAEWIAQLKPPNTLRLAVDIDPQSFL